MGRLSAAIVGLNNDAEWFTSALAEFIESRRPISGERLTKQQRDYLIQSGDFTEQELLETEQQVDRGELQLSEIQSFLSPLLATMSLEGASGYLGLDEAQLRAEIAAGRLHAVEISDRLRFPTWQFSIGHAQRLIPGLQEILAAVPSDWSWISLAALMATPQQDLVGEDRMTPAEWLRHGFSSARVVALLESQVWT
jgi:hypothetical protein